MNLSNNFFAFLSRMKHINRWGLMRNTLPENIQEHSLMTAIVAHALAVISNTYLGGGADPERTAVLALYHDAEETITGDMPTPVKYYSEDIRTAYAKVERVAKDKLLSMLPPEMQGAYRDLLYPEEGDRTAVALVKAADVLCAYIKCVEEVKAGNREFLQAKTATLAKLRALHCKEADIFLERFMPGFEKSLDQLD